MHTPFVKSGQGEELGVAGDNLHSGLDRNAQTGARGVQVLPEIRRHDFCILSVEVEKVYVLQVPDGVRHLPEVLPIGLRDDKRDRGAVVYGEAVEKKIAQALCLKGIIVRIVVLYEDGISDSV